MESTIIKTLYVDSPMRTLRNALESPAKPGKRMRQRELAKILGVDTSLVSMAESGRGLGRTTTLAIFNCYKTHCAQLGLTEGDFLRGVRS